MEIGGGLGDFKGKVWRVGLMGHSCTMENVVLLLGALEKALEKQSVKLPAGAGIKAALAAI